MTCRSCRAGSRRPMRSDSSESWATEGAPPTRRAWRRCCSMRARRSTSRESRRRSRRESAGRAKWLPRAPPGPRSTGCAKRRLVFPDDADDDALDDDVALVQTERLHRLVGGLEPDPAAGLAVEALDGGPFAMDERDDGLAGVGLV